MVADTRLQIVRDAIADLSEKQRAEFEQRYSKSEQRLLNDITGLLPPKPVD